MRILMVCLGNICRSPLAEGIMRDLITSKGLDWTVDSAGTGSWHVDQPPDGRSIAIAAKYGLDITDQRARQFHYPDFDQFDVIFAMDRANYNDVSRQAINAEERSKIRLILEETGAGRKDVPDPYWDDNGFDKVYHMLKKACEQYVADNS